MAYINSTPPPNHHGQRIIAYSRSVGAFNAVHRVDCEGYPIDVPVPALQDHSHNNVRSKDDQHFDGACCPTPIESQRQAPSTTLNTSPGTPLQSTPFSSSTSSASDSVVSDLYSSTSTTANMSSNGHTYSHQHPQMPPAPGAYLVQDPHRRQMLPVGPFMTQNGHFTQTTLGGGHQSYRNHNNPAVLSVASATGHHNVAVHHHQASVIGGILAPSASPYPSTGSFPTTYTHTTNLNNGNHQGFDIIADPNAQLLHSLAPHVMPSPGVNPSALSLQNDYHLSPVQPQQYSPYLPNQSGVSMLQESPLASDSDTLPGTMGPGGRSGSGLRRRALSLDTGVVHRLDPHRRALLDELQSPGGALDSDDRRITEIEAHYGFGKQGDSIFYAFVTPRMVETTRESGRRGQRTHWKCILCPPNQQEQLFERVDRALTHVRAHLGVRSYSCDGSCGLSPCDKTFRTLTTLQHHISHTHHPVTEVCCTCGREILKRNMKRHLKTH